MGMFDTSNFNAPNVNSAVPSLQNFLEYKDQEKQKQMAFEKDMANFQSQLRLKELGQQMDQQRIAKSREPLNVAPPTGLITPALDAQIQLAYDRNSNKDENDRQRNQIAQQNADTKLHLGEEGLTTKKDIATGTNQTREDITNKTLGSKATLQKEGETAKTAMETQKQGNRVTNLNTRGTQALTNIHATGEEARKTKQVASPNVNANNPSQQAIAERSRANQFINSNPDLGKWVSIDPNTNMVHVTPPSTGSSVFGSVFGARGPSVDEYHKILGSIYNQGGTYGTAPDTTNPSPNTTTTTPPTTTPPANQGDKVRVMLPDGRIGFFPKGHPSLNDPRVKILGGGQ